MSKKSKEVNNGLSPLVTLDGLISYDGKRWPRYKNIGNRLETNRMKGFILKHIDLIKRLSFTKEFSYKKSESEQQKNCYKYLVDGGGPKDNRLLLKISP